jgi:hypothetical protein
MSGHSVDNIIQHMVFITTGSLIGGTAGVAGSATVSVVNETTSARIHKGALINTLDTGSAGSEQGVRVTAADLTRVIDAAGGLGGGGAAGIGAGVDVGVLTKNTLASIDDGIVLETDDYAEALEAAIMLVKG